MMTFPIHTLRSAPEASRSALQQLQDGFGFIPNVAGAIANSPTLMNAFAAVFANVHSVTFAEDEVQIVLLTDAVVNRSTWAVAFHSALALQQGVEAEDVRAIREGRFPARPKYAALSGLATKLIQQRGHVSDAELQAFFAPGFQKEQVLEILTIVAASTITNYAASLTDPSLEAQFQQHAWQPQS